LPFDRACSEPPFILRPFENLLIQDERRVEGLRVNTGCLGINTASSVHAKLACVEQSPRVEA